ncbi:unnamed protein product [Musa banksii]
MLTNNIFINNDSLSKRRVIGGGWYRRLATDDRRPATGTTSSLFSLSQEGYDEEEMDDGRLSSSCSNSGRNPYR